jgi:low affinity Fe/Cu permease
MARHPASVAGSAEAREREQLGDRFNRISARITDALGSFTALIASVLLVVVWALTGPIFNFSDTWQLFINTSTTVITFWMVFVIQNSANRDAKAIHLKLDEIIRATKGARNELITLEQAPEAVVAETAKELADVAEHQRGEGVAKVSLTETVDGRTEKATAVSGTGPTGKGVGGSRGGSSSKGSPGGRPTPPRTPA